MSDGASQANPPLPEAELTLSVNGLGTPAVLRAHGVEALHTPWEWAIEVLWPFASAPPTDALVGLEAVLGITRGGLARAFDGVVLQVDDRGVSAEQRRYELLLVPRIALLAQRTQYRVFSDLSSVEIVRAMLDELSLYTGDRWRTLLADAPPKRGVTVQFGETDLGFMSRILAEDGLTFAFAHDAPSEALVVFDGERASALPLTATLDHNPVPVTAHGTATDSVESLRRLEGARAVVPAGWQGVEHDFTHPQAGVKASAGVGSAPIVRYPAGFVLGPIPRGGATHGPANGTRVARARHELEAVGQVVVRGVGVVTGLSAGVRVAVVDPGDAAHRQLDGEYLVTRVVHRAAAPERLLAAGDAETDEERYASSFEAIPSARVFRPAVPEKPRVMFPQSAVVIGESDDATDEIVTDVHGRVLVRFHWDQQPANGGGYRAVPGRHRCWLRAVQPWAGPGWGFHFTPRVGMEVVVHFLDGDPDRPFIAGCLPNALNVPPVDVPQRRTQSAIRTQSSPASGGYNELRFEDLADAEEVYLRAQRDQRVEVLRDRALSVGRDAGARVERDESLAVGRDHSVDVVGDERHDVGGGLQRSIGGDELRDVGGNQTVMLHKSHALHVDQRSEVTVAEGLTVAVGGNSGALAEVSPDEVMVRAPKKYAVAVGDEAVHEITPDHVSAKAPKGLSFACGDTRIEIGEDKIVLQTKGGARVELQGDKITVKTDGPVSIKGSTVSTNG